MDKIDKKLITLLQNNARMPLKALAENVCSENLKHVFVLEEALKAGKSAEEIKQILEEEKLEASIYIMVDTLKYLKKGGRITPAAAALGSMLNLKPVLQLQGEKLDSFAKVRGVKAAKRTMLKAIKNDLETRFAGKKMTLGIAYTSRDEEEVKKWKEEVQEAFPGYEIVMNPLSLSVSCHIGPGSLAVTCTKVVEA